ncbi:putative hydroquinone glucosyltransferase [Rosa chinensis]|uniref:Putative hydroquinone glucosyltransferase n=1 Tax=Rosa chinensis TaxID=74649 RepID=A0A2P6QKY8_ROSCH|nr:putative hydroquinone glucosyltransferase [Rosa chinensis]
MVMAVDEEHTQKPHVAMLSSPGVGHVTPLLELAKRLVVDLGFQVSFLAITTDAPPAQLQLLNNNPTLPSDLHVIHLPHVDVSSNDVIAIRIVQIVRESLRSLPSVLTNLHSHKPPLKALIVDPFCIEALETAADHSIPTYLFLTASASFLALTIYFPTLHADVKGDYGKIKESVFLPGCMPLWVDDLLPDVLIPEVLPLCNRIPLVKGIFVNTWEEIEPVTLSAFRNHPFFVNLPTPTIHSIGPLTKDKDADVESELLKWLDKQPCDSVVYVSFGSGGKVTRNAERCGTGTRYGYVSILLSVGLSSYGFKSTVEQVTNSCPDLRSITVIITGVEDRSRDGASVSQALRQTSPPCSEPQSRRRRQGASSLCLAIRIANAPRLGSSDPERGSPVGAAFPVTLGGTLSAEQMMELAHGLELSGKRFLWVARPPRADDASGSFFEAGVDGALTASYLPDGFSERTRGAGLVTATWAPQVAVLSHPSVCGFVTHCGWNSVMESVVHGVVMVAWPLYAEQKMNARALVEMGVAVRPEAGGDGVVGRAEVERVVRMVVEGEEGKEMRRSTREMQRSAVDALGGGGSSSGGLSRLGKEWRDGSTS